MKYVYVIINSTTQSLDKAFLYAASESLSLDIGDCVEVPFGVKNAKTEAFVMNIIDEIPERDASYESKIKEVGKIIFKEAFNKRDIETIKFIRNKYLSSFLDAIRLFIAKGSLKGANYKSKTVLMTKNEPYGKFEKYLDIYNFIQNSKESLTKSDVAKQGFSISSINTMIKHGFLETIDINNYRYSFREFEIYAKPVLNDEQKEAIRGIEESDKTTTLLHGITGSGKTEVFMQLVENALLRDEDCVVLVPEISLTPQMIERFKGRFGSEITIYHSRMNDGERFDEWMRVKNSNVKIAIGARSALFLPFNNLKLVIIDEEHESSYKSESNPKYRTSEVAEFMLRNGGKVVLSSATPRLESYYKAEEGLINLEELKKRASKSELPEFEIVDMRQELIEGNRSILSNRLKELIDEKLNLNQQIILFINRRGYSSFVSCRKCGYVYKCSNCSVSLTLHNGSNLICHHCGYSEKLKQNCPSCGSNMIKKFGIGTEQVEKAVLEEFPKARILRMDKDTTSAKSSFEKIYESFKNKEADILIGTQMVAKGFDFNDVTLVGILSADMSLNIPDFRSYENTYSLITQVSGRAGRGKEKGKVLLQGYDTDNYAIQSAVNYDFKSFYKKEMENRKLLGYPPFDNIFSIVLSSENEVELQKEINNIGILLRKNLKMYNIIVLGPNPSLISKIKGLFRYQILLKGKIDSKLGLSIKKLIYDSIRNKEIRVSLDTDPEYML